MKDGRLLAWFLLARSLFHALAESMGAHPRRGYVPLQRKRQLEPSRLQRVSPSAPTHARSRGTSERP